MDIRHLTAFVTAAKSLSITEAAKRLYISQSSLSKQISELEQTIGVKLFIRHYRSLELTAAGKYLLKEGDSLIQKANEILNNTRQVQRGMRGILKIGCFTSQLPFMPDVLKKFYTLYPQIKLDIQIYPLKTIEELLMRNELDFGFITKLGQQLEYRQFCSQLVYRLPLAFVLPVNHPLAAESAITPSVLAKESFMVLSQEEPQDGVNWLIQLCQRHGFTPQIAFKSNHFESILWQVGAGMGVSFTARHPKISIPETVSVVDILDEDALRNTLVIWKNTNSNPAIPLFLKVLTSIACIS